MRNPFWVLLFYVFVAGLLPKEALGASTPLYLQFYAYTHECGGSCHQAASNCCDRQDFRDESRVQLVISVGPHRCRVRV